MKRMSRHVAMALAVLLVAAAGPSVRTNLAATPISRLDLPWWKARHEAVLARVRGEKIDLIWLGDSITQNWERAGPPDWADFQPVWQHFYGSRRAVNMGFTGDTTASLLWRIRNGEVAGIAPKAAIVLIGANNLGRLHWSAADTIAGIEAIVAELRKRLPSTRILLIGVLPSDRSAWADRTTVTINAALKARYGDDALKARHGGGGAIAYVDPAPVFFHNGRLDHGLFYDPLKSPPGAALHPTAAGMRQLAEAIEPTLAAMMAARY